MTLSIICTDRDPIPWVTALQEIDPSLSIHVWPDERQWDEVTFALCWKHPAGVLQSYPNLQCISSMGAGVDHLLNDALLPQHLPVVRLVDPGLAQSMFEYLCTAVMYYFREFDAYHTYHSQALWHQRPPKMMAQTTIGVMGLGQLGGYVAQKLAQMGFNVVGWSRTEKAIANVTTYAGKAALPPFLHQTHILICLLPLTAQTGNILNAELFRQLPQGAYLINVARGEHMVEEDLLIALADGQLQGACLDVFRTEPLPPEHPFWSNSKIILTPHCSSITNPRSVAPQIVENYRRIQQQKPLLNLVSVQHGY